MRLVIPYAGNMFKSNIGKCNTAICFSVNKGYLESDELQPLYYLKESLEQYSWLYFVGGIDKIHLGSSKYCYRQRIFFKDFDKVCDICKENGIVIGTTPDFRISINNVINCGEFLKYIEWYANSFSETIETYLTNTCKVQIYNLLQDKCMFTTISKEVSVILSGKEGYLDRAPFLAKSYSTDSKTSKLYTYNGCADVRLYTQKDLKDIDRYGLSGKVVAYDRKAGVFKNEG